MNRINPSALLAAALLLNAAQTTHAAPAEEGQWGEVIQWPHIAISASNLPDGRVLTWASNEVDRFPGGGPDFSHSSVFDPVSGEFTDTNNGFHDMFCAGISTLEDGRIVASGGNPFDNRTSVFNPASLEWSALANMNDQRWYGTNITLPDNRIFSTFAKEAGNRTELYNPDTNSWARTPHAYMQTVLDEQNRINGRENNANTSNLEWFTHLAVTPQGKVFQGGPTPTWHEFDPVGGAAIESLGQPIGDVSRMYGNAVTYDEGKVMLVGGYNRGVDPAVSTENAILVDLNGATPVVTRAAPMNFARAFSNTVTLANGELLVVGGNTSARIFNDEGSVLPAEIYNPATNSWRVMSSISVPRNYHSTALLLKDGRVLSAGGGACGNCNENHLDGQIFSPPYLFNDDDSLATRPSISQLPGTAEAGQSINVQASTDTTRFSLVRLSGTTHHMNTDQRFLPISSVNEGDGNFTLTLNANPNVLIPGNYWLFALNANDTPSMGANLQIQRAREEAESSARRYVRLTALSEVRGNIWASAAEINLLNEAGESLDRSGWAATGSSEETSGEDGRATNVLDGNNGTIWHSRWTGSNVPNYPHSLVIDMGEPKILGGLSYLPRPGAFNGTIARYEIHVSNNGVDWDEPVASGEFANTADLKTVNFTVAVETPEPSPTPTPTPTPTPEPDPVPDTTSPELPRYVRLTALSEVRGNVWASAAEINLLNEAGGSLDRSGWIATASSQETGGENGRASNVLDGNNASIWHSRWTGSNVPNYPHSLVIDMTAAQDIRGLSYLPRSGGGNGTIARYEIHVSTNGSDWGEPVASGEFANSAGLKTVAFELPESDGSDGGGDDSTDEPPEIIDTDGDGVADNEDAFPDNASESKDSDGDGTGDNADAFPNDADRTAITRRYVRLTALNEVRGNVWASAAEINILDNSGEAMDRSGWTATGSSEETRGENGRATNVLDGNNRSIWHSRWTGSDVPNYPHSLVIDMAEAKAVGGLTYLPRSGAFNGTIAGYEIHTSKDGQNWGEPVATGTFANNGDLKTVRFSLEPAHSQLPQAPRHSTTLLVEQREGTDRLWNVNPDNNSVSVSSADGQLLAEIAVGNTPWALAKSPITDRIYVTNKQSATISIINTATLAVEDTVSLTGASQPHGIVFDADGSHYFVVLEATATVQKRQTSDNSVVRSLVVGGTPRHLSMAYDDSRLLVSNFITPLASGESTATIDRDSAAGQVFVLDPVTMDLSPTLGLPHDNTVPSESVGPGLPNYLAAAAFSFDSTKAYVPGKKDNIDSGSLRNKPGMSFDQTVRAQTSVLDLGTGEFERGIDHDNSSVVTGTALSGDGRYLFATLETSRELVVYDLRQGFQLMRLPTGRAPQSVALSSDGAMAYVHNFMDRSLSRFDLRTMFETELPDTNELPAIAVVTDETLEEFVLTGKQFFYDAQDNRLARDNYMSCASCHKEGKHDGRVWDFTSLGEGLRNTPSLRGKAGLGQGVLHWTGNFDELQDFEGQIRTFAGGSGLMSDADFNTGTRNQPLGDAKAGISADLDALAAYLSSLDEAEASPITTSSEAEQGRVLFEQQNCSACHSGSAGTDSALDVRHDVGTITGDSGLRNDGLLLDLDTPTLLGLHASAPYLHNGSAATVSAAIRAHTNVTISEADADLIEAYLLQLGAAGLAE